MVHLNGSNRPEELKRKLKEGLKKEGKDADLELIKKAIRIFENTKRVHWDHRFLQQWPEYGLYYVYIATEAMDAELEPMMELVELDKQMGYTCDKGVLELSIFRFKALKIIGKEEVGNCQSDSFSSDQKLNYLFRAGTNGALSMITVWVISSVLHTFTNLTQLTQRSSPKI